MAVASDEAAAVREWMREVIRLVHEHAENPEDAKVETLRAWHNLLAKLGGAETELRLYVFAWREEIGGSPCCANAPPQPVDLTDDEVKAIISCARPLSLEHAGEMLPPVDETFNRLMEAFDHHNHYLCIRRYVMNPGTPDGNIIRRAVDARRGLF